MEEGEHQHRTIARTGVGERGGGRCWASRRWRGQNPNRWPRSPVPNNASFQLRRRSQAAEQEPAAIPQAEVVSSLAEEAVRDVLIDP